MLRPPISDPSSFRRVLNKSERWQKRRCTLAFSAAPMQLPRTVHAPRRRKRCAYEPRVISRDASGWRICIWMYDLFTAVVE